MQRDTGTWRNTLTLSDAIVSLGGAFVTLGASFFETLQVPWTIRIPAALATAAIALWLWRSMTLRRLLVPNKLQSFYENDLMSVDELFHGRSRISGTTFKNVELTGPGGIFLRPDCKLVGDINFNPSVEDLILIPKGPVSVEPFYSFSNCTFENVVFTRVAIIIVMGENDGLLGVRLVDKINIENKEVEGTVQ